MDQQYSQSDNGISPEDIEKFNQQYAAKLSLADDLLQAQGPQQAPSAPLIYNSGQFTILDQNFAAKIHECNNMQFTNQHWDSIVSSLFSQDILQQHYGIIGIRKLLSIEDKPPIQQVIDAQLVPVLILYAQQNQYPQLKFEALWALTNVASGTTSQTKVVVDKGGITLFVGCLYSPVLAIVQQAIWAIGNLAGDNILFRDLLNSCGTLQKLVSLIAQNSHHLSLAKNGMWALCNMCRGNPRPQFTMIKNGVHFCCQYLIEKDEIDKEVLTQILWVLAYPDQLKDNLDFETANRLIFRVSTYLSSPFASIIVPILRLLSNLFENEAFADCFIKNKWIELLVPLLTNPKLPIQRETCFLISRLTDIHNYEIFEIFVSPLIVQTLFKAFETADCSVKSQIAYLFANLSCHDNLQKVYEFYRQTDILKYYVSILTSDQKYILAALNCLDRILQVGQKFTENGQNMLVVRLEELNAVTTLENLQYHSNIEIYQTVLQILDKYFSIEQNEDDIDQVNNNNQNFGAAPIQPELFANSNPFQL